MIGVAGRTHVPLTDRSVVVGGGQQLGQSRFGQIQYGTAGSADAGAQSVASGQNLCPRRCAGGIRVCVAEQHALGRELIDTRSRTVVGSLTRMPVDGVIRINGNTIYA